MIESIRIVNFRQIEDQTIELSPTTVVVGPNNGGKTTLLQAISLFAMAVKKWGSERGNVPNSKKKSSVAFTLEELNDITTIEFRELWKDLKLNDRSKKNDKTIQNVIKIQIHCTGHTLLELEKNKKEWQAGFEFSYARNNLIYARLIKNQADEAYSFPEILLQEQIGYLPSVSDLKPTEYKFERGGILHHIGHGNTAEVLRNICYLVYEGEDKSKWDDLVGIIQQTFKIGINPPQYLPTTGLLKMSYQEGDKTMDLSSLGSGSRQAILLFAYLFAFPNTVTLLDEPDAHLEVIRQKNIYDKLTDLAKRNNSQIIIATHSEGVLDRAFSKDAVISSVLGQFKRENEEGKKKISYLLWKWGYEELLSARDKKRVLYFEGSTDLDFLRAFAGRLGFGDFCQFIEEGLYPKAVGNDVSLAKHHFDILKHFVPELKGYALFDNLDKDIQDVPPGLIMHQWKRKEIENYLPLPQCLYGYVEDEELPAFEIFENIVAGNTPPEALRDLNHSFWQTTKISDNYLAPLFEQFFDEIKYPRGTMDKSKFYLLVDHSPKEAIDGEIKEAIESMQRHLTIS